MRTRLVLLAALFAAAPAAAQVAPPAPQPGEELWDGVVAVVGDTVLLRSDLLLAVEQIRATGQPMPQDSAGYDAMVRQLAEDRVNALLLLEGARAAGVTVSDDEVRQSVDQQIAEVRQRFGGEGPFQQALAQSGRTIDTYRAELTAQFRDETVSNRFVSRRLQAMAPPAVTDAEIRAFFEENKARFGARPAAVSFQQVMVRPMASDTARATALRIIQTVQRELLEGGDFEALARRYSMDGTKERGGDLGWFRQGQMVREFNDAAFAMRPGQTSGIIETEFGFHIIRLDKVRGPERQARHILVRPTITPADVERARTRADSVAQALRGGADAAALAAQYRTPDEARFQRDVPLDRLPPALLSTLEGATTGTVAGPVQLDGNGNPVFSVLRVTGRQTAGEYTLDDVRDVVRQRLQEERLRARLLEQLRRDTYVSMRL